MSVMVAQLGARMHYAVPRILHRAGLLERLYTDICASKGWPRILGHLPRALRPARLQRLANRIPEGIPPRRIAAFTGFGLEYARRLARAHTTDARNAAFLWSGREFGRRVVAGGFGQARSVYTFNSAGLEILREAHKRGLSAVTEQTIAPRSIERALLREEALRFPDWEVSEQETASMNDYCAREAAEWAAADVILCGSEFVKEGVIACGGAKDRCAVVPYGIENGGATLARSARRPGLLRVLTVGAICLRKGAPYVAAAAEQLAGRAEFRMVGAIQVLPEAEKKLRRHVQLAGIVARSEMAAQYAWADVFLLPSLCEGSATVTYEAMARGLPVICTPQTGSTVRDGTDGFIVPSRDAGALVKKLALLASEPELLATLSKNARQNSADYTLDRYGERLLATFRERKVI